MDTTGEFGLQRAAVRGRRAVVVGAGSRLARATARRFAIEGADVLLVDSDAAALETAIDELRQQAPRATGELVDVKSEAAVAAFTTWCSAAWPCVDVLFIATAAMDHWPTEADDIDLWNEVLTMNLLVPAMFTHAMRTMLERSDGASVIYLGSIDGSRGNPNVPAYSASKGGLVSLTHLYAQALGPAGVRVNCIATGAISHLPESAPAPERQLLDPRRALELTPLRRKAHPDEIASVAAFFASSDSSYVTGAVLPVDGGRTAGTPGTDLTDIESRPAPEWPVDV